MCQHVSDNAGHYHHLPTIFLLVWVSNKLILNSLPHYKIRDLTKLKAIADNKINVAHNIMMIFLFDMAELHSSVRSIVYLRTRGRLFNPQLSQYSFQGLMIVIATGFIPLSPLSIVLILIMWKSSQWLGKNIVRSTG